MEGVWAGDLPLLMAVCPSLSSPSTLFPVSLSSCVSLDSCFSGCHPIHLCLLCYLGLLSPSLALIPLCLLGCLSLSLSLNFPILTFCALFLSPWLILGHFCVYLWSLGPISALPSLSISLSVSVFISGTGLCPSIPASIPVLGPATVSHAPLISSPFPAHLSSSVPSSPLSPSPSAVSPTGSACCSHCSCTAAWEPWPGATSPQ